MRCSCTSATHPAGSCGWASSPTGCCSAAAGSPGWSTGSARQGLIERERCKNDGRGYYALLTDAGSRLLASARPDHLDGVRRHFIERLEPEQIDALAGVWSRLRVQPVTRDLDEAA